MLLNSKKFELLRYGHDDVLIATTSYTGSDGAIIPAKDHVKDLGIFQHFPTFLNISRHLFLDVS